MLGDADARAALDSTRLMLSAARDGDWQEVRRLEVIRAGQLLTDPGGGQTPASALHLSELMESNERLCRLAAAQRAELGAQTSALRRVTQATRAYGLASG